tara:strand:+ start:937 stop:1269 length:333 start_codon:yes stop_codon:yes gene_type:complete
MVANNIEVGETNWNEDDDPVSIYEVSKMLNFKESTVSSWRQRHQMPKPDKMVSGGKTPLWKKKTILDWAKNTNRLRNMQTDSFAYKQEDDTVSFETSLDDFQVGDLEWNG